MTAIFDRISNTGVIPVAVIDDIASAEPLAAALSDGGLKCVEITMRTPCAAQAIKITCETHPEMLVGAGTVLNVENAMTAVAAGAKFIVSPGFDPSVAKFCAARGISFFPGTVTPTEITAALAAGVNTLKFFPAEAFGGVATLKALSAPFGGVKFMPTGGITPENFKTYLKLPSVFACGGSFMVASALVKNGEFDKIRTITRKCVEDMLSLEPCAEFRKMQLLHGLPDLTFTALTDGKKGSETCKNMLFTVTTDFADRAVFLLAENGAEILSETREKNARGKTVSVLLKDRFFGAQIKLKQKSETA